MPKYFRRVIRIPASLSPNVRLGLMQQSAGLEPSDEVICQGVLTWGEYAERMATWDEDRRTIGLHAEFVKNKHALLFPPDWLDWSHHLHKKYVQNRRDRRAVAIGVDPAEGRDFTSFAVIDHLGLIELMTEQTPNTNKVYETALGLLRRYNVSPENMVFDRGGGGKQHADRLIAAGFNVRSVGFSENAALPLQTAKKSLKKRIDEQGDRYVYPNKRIEMYWELSDRMNPEGEWGGFSIPERLTELRRQLAPFPKRYDDEGRAYLPAKKPKPNASKTAELSLEEMIGRSPDDADALALALYAITHPASRPVAGLAM